MPAVRADTNVGVVAAFPADGVATSNDHVLGGGLVKADGANDGGEILDVELIDDGPELLLVDRCGRRRRRRGIGLASEPVFCHPLAVGVTALSRFVLADVHVDHFGIIWKEQNYPYY